MRMPNLRGRGLDLLRHTTDLGHAMSPLAMEDGVASKPAP